MAQGFDMTKEWLAKNRQQMIRCPYQAGNLFISKKACAKRHAIGRKSKNTEIKRNDSFFYAVNKGLSLCRQCPIGEKAVYSLPMVRRMRRTMEQPRIAA